MYSMDEMAEPQQAQPMRDPLRRIGSSMRISGERQRLIDAAGQAMASGDRQAFEALMQQIDALANADPYAPPAR